MRQPQLRSPLARAVFPVLAGIGVVAVISVATWGMAVYIANSEDPPDQFVPNEFEVGNIENLADLVDEDGPILFAGLNTSTGRRSIVLDHDASTDAEGWAVYLAHPADRDDSCKIEQERGTATFIDCEERRLEVTDLAAPPDGVNPILDGKTLLINLRGFSATPPTTATTIAVGS